ncbi:MAG: Gamma-glutamyltranspeptidase [Alphaproteobacteria bacterium MarineAlpha6_Bin4]|nr:MAG: Gamma-glutamyltranspeptidase [Alphaproteobacteria bacterium MarineAlpha6_Bin3]PPR37342.1 MAG: Gamma-glutamyltranspeptidase [Alphaproteobacteria bacterium MarineAlpha6_Bin4]
MFKSTIKIFFFLFLFLIKNAYANNFAISTSHPIATKVGKNILHNGGSAIDAVIGVQMVLNLVEPQSSGIGGGGFLLYFDKKNSKLSFYDGRETAPNNIKKEFFLNEFGDQKKFYEIAVGGQAIGVPGLLSMLEIAHKDHGLLQWEELFTPAIKLSENGFKISSRLHKLIKRDSYLYLFPESKKYFYNKNKKYIKLIPKMKDEIDPKKKNQILKNPKFGETLKIIAKKKSKGFYEGAIAKEMVNKIKKTHIKKGVLELEDLKNYKAKKRSPLCGKYRKFRVCSAAPPSAGGFSILQILGIMEEFDLSKKNINENIHLIIEASKYSYNDRYRYLGDPDFSNIKINNFLEKEYLKKISSKIKNDKQVKYNIYKNSFFIPKSTTHFSIIDKYGNVASVTSSIENAFGSRLMANGFLLNNQLSDFNFKIENDLYKNNIIEANKKPLSSMSPTIIFDENDNVKMVIGSPGGKSIIMYVVKTIIAVLDWKMNIQEAVDFPNFSISNNKVIIEKNSDKKLKKYLMYKGHEIVEKNLTSGLNGFEIKNKTIYGAADKRRSGLVLYN